MTDNKWRAIFVSDVHLGTPGCKADILCDFLKHHECDQLYLVGDIIDMWAMNRSVTWPQSHSNVVRRLLTKAKRGTKVTYIPGNHDEFMRPYLRSPMMLGNITMQRHAEHVDANGRTWLVTHGDMFDVVTRHWRWLSLLGDRIYGLLLKANALVHRLRRILGLGYWSLSKFIKSNTKQAVGFITQYENQLAQHAEQQDYHGVICGHIHKQEIRKLGSVWYLNCGDFVESCSALAEAHDGSWHALEWDGDGWRTVQRLDDLP